MLIPAQINGKVVGVLGLGRSGLAAAASLLAAGATVFLADDYKIPELARRCASPPLVRLALERD